MCFIGSIFISKKKIAQEDITCYKCGSIFFSQYDNPKFHPVFFKTYFYLKGYIPPILKLKRQIVCLFWFNIHEGYHAYKRPKNEMSILCANVEKFIIPKGSTYYENRIEYVSDSIIWVGN